jgi:hypothetical protein
MRHRLLISSSTWVCCARCRNAGVENCADSCGGGGRVANCTSVRIICWRIRSPKRGAADKRCGEARRGASCEGASAWAEAVRTNLCVGVAVCRCTTSLSMWMCRCRCETTMQCAVHAWGRLATGGSSRYSQRRSVVPTGERARSFRKGGSSRVNEDFLFGLCRTNGVFCCRLPIAAFASHCRCKWPSRSAVDQCK